MGISMRKFSIAAGLAVALVPLAALAAESADQPAAPAQSPKAVQSVSAAENANPVSCRVLYYQGSLVRRPICLTAHEWERQRILQERLVRQFQIQTLSDPM